MVRRTVAVSGMSCGGCEQNVEDALSELPGVTGVTADSGADTVELTTESDVDTAAVHAAIEDAGYEVTG